MKNICNNITFIVILICVLFLSTSCGKKELTSEDARKEIAKLNIQYNESSFYDAIYNNDTLLINLFLKAGMDPNIVFSVKDKGTTPFILSIIRHNNELSNLFLSKKADVNKKIILNNDEITALFFAITSLDVAGTNLLLNNGANTIFKINGKYISAHDLIKSLINDKVYYTYPDRTKIVMDTTSENNAKEILNLINKYITRNSYFENNKKYFTGDIDLKKVFNLLFGNYDEKTGESIWNSIIIPINVDKHNVFKNQNSGIVSKYIFSNYEEDGKSKFILITSTRPTVNRYPYGSDNDNFLSGFIFVKENNNWAIEVKQYFIKFNDFGDSSPDGQPKVWPVKIGPHKIGLAVDQKYFGSGATGNYKGNLKWLIYPVNYDNIKIVELGNDMKYEETKGYTKRRNSEGDFSNNDYEYFVNYEFIKDDNKKYYDIKVNTRGNGTESNSGKKNQINKTEYWSLVNDKYVKTKAQPPKELIDINNFVFEEGFLSKREIIEILKEITKAEKRITVTGEIIYAGAYNGYALRISDRIHNNSTNEIKSIINQNHNILKNLVGKIVTIEGYKNNNHQDILIESINGNYYAGKYYPPFSGKTD